MQGWSEDDFWRLSDDEKITWLAYYELRNEEQAEEMKRQERMMQMKQRMGKR